MEELLKMDLTNISYAALFVELLIIRHFIIIVFKSKFLTKIIVLLAKIGRTS